MLIFKENPRFDEIIGECDFFDDMSLIEIKYVQLVTEYS